MWSRPAANAIVAGKALGVVGSRGPIVVPSPIWPVPFAPQHIRTPSTSSAQACCHRAASAFTLPTPATRLGPRGGGATAPPSPSWPALSSPQQRRLPSMPAAHEKSLPAASALAPVTPATARGSP